ncbi:MAG: DNA polymerase III subunit epsilon [Bifidobacteriaceae bacterium]|jgi:DNA polymerase-3 subunit epsilon|nr:DNA polymerase III subunit epsilon [Bifidobacteriaceae bacterium]
MRNLVGFDTETTGVATERDRIVTAAMVRRPAEGGEVTMTWLIDPGVEIPPQATAVHGITTERARAEGRAPAEALDEIAGHLAAALAEGLAVLAFNAAYDLRILKAELERHGLATLEQRLGGAVAPVVDPLVIDRAADRYRKGKRKLEDLMAVYGVESSHNLHDALEDVRQSIAVFDAIERRHAQVAAMDLAALHDWQRQAHRDWADHFNQWLSSRGRPADADPSWP